MQETSPALPKPERSAVQQVAIDSRMAETDAFSLPPLMLQYWQAIVRRRFLIAAMIAVSLGAGVVWTMLQPRLYTARSQVEISRAQKNFTNVQGVDQGQDYQDYEFYETQYALMRARSLAERVAKNLKLADDPSFFAAHGAELPEGQPQALSPQERKRLQDLAASLLLGGISVEPVKNSSLVNVQYTSESPQWSARIANAWPQEFIGASMDRQFASSADARRFLEVRLEGLRQRMNEAENALIEFGNSRNIVKLGGSRDAQGRTEEPRTLVAANLEALNAALVQARTERIAAASRMGVRGSDSSSDVMQNATVSGLRNRRAELAAEYARLLVQFEPGYPAALALKSQIDELDSAIALEIGRAGAARRASYAEALKREIDLADQVRQLKAQFDQEQRDTIQYNIFQREVDTNRQLYDALLQRYKEIGVAGTVGATNIVVVDHARVPGSPSSPDLMANLLMAMLAGLGLSALTVFGLEQMDEGIRNPADVEKLLHLPLLGNVPLTSDQPESKLFDPKSGLSEAYFSVRTTLALATTHGLPRSLVVTSAQPGEGKSITALALAVAIGRTDKGVLLIDADMRSPSLHKLVGVNNVHGLSNLLAGADDTSSMIQQTGHRGVALLPSGPAPPSAPELLATDRMNQLLGILGERFDFIVIDSPPIIGIADAPLLGRIAEGCVFVIEAEKTAIRTIRSALKRLRVGDNQIFGAVVTKIDFSQNRYGYGYSYGYGHDDAKGAAA